MPPSIETLPSTSDSVIAFSNLMERIDRRSYHTFEFNGQRLLFDRSTGTTLEVSELAFAILHGHQSLPIAELVQRLSNHYQGIDLQELVEPISSLKRRGFFRFKNVNLEEQTEALEALMETPAQKNSASDGAILQLRLPLLLCLA
ncbi:MAG TPA: hypothetical protein VHD56_16030 [Tepidisphaeraceae bacterium]|nr:hypothetical protein [Tepidisphaeraceae bacterium]